MNIQTFKAVAGKDFLFSLHSKGNFDALVAVLAPALDGYVWRIEGEKVRLLLEATAENKKTVARALRTIGGDLLWDGVMHIKDEPVTESCFTRVKNDVNGNGRYVLHFYDMMTDAEIESIRKEHGMQAVARSYNFAVARAKSLGGRRYRGADYGGGIVFQCVNLPTLIKRIEELKGGADG